ncbi:MAG: hypothetical protein IAG13_28795 [Deltaproteobacteria bacterium]|nr:hypothetical protein [Nannocystaceae bacterium]
MNGLSTQTPTPVLAVFALLSACSGRAVVSGEGDASTSGSADTSSSGSTVAPTTTIDPSNVTAPDSSSEAGSDESGCPGGSCTTDIGEQSCDLWAQDCPPGYKCSPFSNDGGSAWNDSHCVPIDAEPAGVGEPCTVTGSALTGVDDCVFGAFCWDVDRTGQGECYELCRGSESDPVCTDPTAECNVSADGVLIICLPTCDPVGQDCDEGYACYPALETFHCLPDPSPADGGYADPCEFVNVCDPGLFCAAPERVPGCVGASGCCSEFCDLELGDPDASCAGAAQGQVCVPWFEEGMAPPALAHVGACSLPE